MVKNIAIKSSFLQDLETRKRLKDLNLHELWNLILDAIQDKTELYSRGRRSGSSGVRGKTAKP